MKAEIQPFRRLNLTVSMWLEAFSIIIELSHKILWEEFRIKTNHKGRLRIAAFQSYNSKDYDYNHIGNFTPHITLNARAPMS